MRKFDFIYVIGSLERGGAETHLSQVVPMLQARGKNCLIYTLDRKGALASRIAAAGVTIVNGGRFRKLTAWLPPKFKTLGYMFFLISDLCRLLLKNRTAVLHAFLPHATLFSGLAGMLVQHPIRIHSRRSLNHYQKKHPILTKLERFFLRRSTAVLGNSRAVIEDLLSEGIPEKKLHLIHNGIHPLPLPLRRTPDNELGLLMVANLIPYKGHLDLIHAIGMIKSQLPQPWRLRLAGTGKPEYVEVLKDEISKNHLGSNVEFLGSRDDVAQLYSDSDIGLLVSHEEGFSNAVLEGMSAGKPMIVTQVGGNPDAITHKETGWIVPAHDSKAIADAILYLAKDPELRDKLGRNALKTFKERFRLEVCVEKYEEFYQSLFLKNGSRHIVGLPFKEKFK